MKITTKYDWDDILVSSSGKEGKIWGIFAGAPANGFEHQAGKIFYQVLFEGAGTTIDIYEDDIGDSKRFKVKRYVEEITCPHCGTTFPRPDDACGAFFIPAYCPRCSQSDEMQEYIKKKRVEDQNAREYLQRLR